MEGIAEAHQAGDMRLCVEQIVGDMLATRPPMDLPPISSGAPLGHRGNGRTVFVHEPLGLRRRLPRAALPPRGHVGKLEAQRSDTALSQQAGNGLQERGCHARARPMGAEEARLRASWPADQELEGHSPLAFP